MKFLTLFAAMIGALFSTMATAGGIDNFRGSIDMGSVTAIVTPLSRFADDYEAIVANVRSLDVRIDPNRIRADVQNATAFFEDGFKQDGRGFAVGVGFDLESIRFAD